MLSPEERTGIKKVSLENKKVNKKPMETSNALSHIAGSVMTGADLAAIKIGDIGSMIMAPGEVLLEKVGLGTPKEIKEVLEQHRANTVNNIKERREKLDKYAEAKPLRGSVLKIGTGFIEQSVDPIQMGMNIATDGFLLNALQNTIDYWYEQTMIEDRDVKDFGMQDVVNIGTGIAMAGIVEKMKVDTLNKLYDDVDYTKKKSKGVVAPLDKIIQGNQEDSCVLDKKAIGEFYKRVDSGQTYSLPKGYHGAESISKTIDEGVIPRLRKISKANTETKLKQKYNGDTVLKDVATKGNVAQTIKPIYTEVGLAKQQALGEVADDLSGWLIKNGKYDGVTPVGNILSQVTDKIETDEMVRIWQGKSKRQEHQELQKILRNYINEFISIKSGEDVMGKEQGFYIDTLYNKQHFMTKLTDLADNIEVLSDDVENMIKSQLKNIGENIVLEEEDAALYGLGSGTYSLENTPQLLKKLLYDINATTKSVAKAGRKGTLDFQEKSLFDVAFDWVNITGKEKYSKLKELPLDKLTEEEIRFKKNFEHQLFEKFESIFKGYESNKKEVMQNIIATIVDERSGYNKVMEKFDNFTTAYKANGEATTDIKWLDFILDNGTGKELFREIESMRKGLSAYGSVKEKVFDDLALGNKSIVNMKNYAGYKLLFGLRHLREASPNIGIVNSGGYKLGFNDRYSYMKGIYQMGKTHFDLAKNVKSILDNDLSRIADPIERFETEMFIRRMLESNYSFGKKGFSSTLQAGAKIAGSGQLVSDIHRTGAAIRFTSKAMYDEFTKMRLDTMAPEMRAILESNGIGEKELMALQKQIKGFGSYGEFLKFALNSSVEEGGKLKSIFEQFTDVIGREFEAYEKDITKMEASGFLGKFFLNSQMLFKRYSMGAFNRAWKNITTYYDSDDILRYRFLSDGKFNLSGIKGTANWAKGFKHHSVNLTKMSAGLWLSTQAINYIHGKAFGTSADEMVAAKYEAMMDGDYLPILADGIVDSLADYVGYDVMFGGGSAFFGTLATNYKALQRAATSDLDNWQKVMYGVLYTVSPQNISRGIDNIKFGKNISTKLTTWSEDAQFLWKEYYRDDALEEQENGELPIERFLSKTNWEEFFENNPEKAYEVTNLPDDTDEKVVKTYASGVMGLAEESIRDEHINYAFAHEDIEEREIELKRMGLDYGTQLQEMDPKIRKLFHCVMAFKRVDDPQYLIAAMEEVNNSKNKKEALSQFLLEDEIDVFDNFADNVFRHEEELQEIASREYSDDTEGYIEFLETLRNEI
ncbi:hypothetical protein MWG07_10110 [Fusobacterium necrophorum]|uniref:Uncharacterized protein n=1 Tax=Fusobacterium necrophorum TaxID=859 RepID=A0AAW6WEK7_9FUSO|nr:hypothetical protein [Fusobacterium necrophorum]MDK4481545.1 hypothetical protein [Fusobacterium necrophorum]MDK4512604.1 hypothetical protein [Fusobacterium necrophorum]